jgi:vacuolar-type H+-ATPase catalytic subunit A/Vma1
MRVALAALILLGAAPQDDVVKKIVPDADKIKKVAKKLPPAGQAKVEKALNEKLAPADLAPVLYECYSTVPKVSSMEKTRCLVVVVTVKGAKGPVKLGVAAAPIEKTLHVVKVLENGDDKALESKSFLSQFEGLEYTEHVYNASSVLDDAIKKAADAKDDATKELDMLLRMNTQMRTVGPAWERLREKIEKKDKTAADDAVALGKSMEDANRMIAAAKFLKPTQHDKFKSFASGAVTDLADLKKLVDTGKFDDAYRKTGEVDSQRCAKCHGAYRLAFKEARFTHQLGNGYFSTRLEVAMPDPKLEASYQAVAAGIRKAVLLMAEAK